MAESKKKNRKRKLKEDRFPTMVSSWNLKHLTDIGLSYAKKPIDPIEIVDRVPDVCKKISNDCIDKMNYLIENMDFELVADVDGIDFHEELEPRKQVALRFFEMLKSNARKLDQEAALTRVSEYHNMNFPAQQLMCRMKEYILREYYHQQRYKQFYTDMMMNFGQIFSLLPESGGSMKKQMDIAGSRVSSVPDIRFKLMNNGFDLKKPDWIVTVVSVVEVKDTSISMPVNRSSSHWSLDETKDEFNINCLGHKILGQHGGELLVEYKSAETSPYIIGMIVLESKVIITSLKLSNREYLEIEDKGKLPGEDTVEINYSRPLDVLLQHDRKILYEIFFRLSKTCCSSQLSI